MQNIPNADDLNDLEQRLSAWRPAGDGIDVSAMLFAAGRASARAEARRWAWPALAASLALLAAGLAGWAASERAERIALASQLRLPVAPPLPADSPAWQEPAITEEPAADNYLSVMQRALEGGFDDHPARADPSREPRTTPTPTPNSRILQVWQRDAVLDL